MANNLCCYDRVAYTINSTISSSMSKDGCVRANIDCVHETAGEAKMILSVKNFCKNYATKEAMKEMKDMIVKQMEVKEQCKEDEKEGKLEDVGKEGKLEDEEKEGV